MIHPEDVAFHTPADVKYDWGETNFFNFYVPEVNLAGWIWTIARPGIGAFAADITVINKISDQPIDAVYIDFQQHLPMPAKLEDYSLPNGLSVKTHNEPRDYHIRYVGHDDTEFDLYAAGLMDPYDIHDPAMNPLASGNKRRQTGFGAPYANHFDMTVQVKGTAKVRGRKFDVDCVSIMDHSWGTRNERLLNNMGWMNACFGPDYSVHMIATFDPMAKGWEQLKFDVGYALVDGKVRGLKSGRVRVSRRGQYPVGYEMRVVDIDDREHVFIGVVVAQFPWAWTSNSHAKLSIVHWYADGKEGYGHAQENWAMDRLTGRDFRRQK